MVNVKRRSIRFEPDAGRIIARFFAPGDTPEFIRIIETLAKLSGQEIDRALSSVLRHFADRHRNIKNIFEQNYNAAINFAGRGLFDSDKFSIDLRLLIGSYFTNEYSFESSAFFNPSIVEDPDQSNLAPGHRRMILSFRATGEGHISSLVFRRIELDNSNEPTMMPTTRYSVQADRVKRHVYEKSSFIHKLNEMGIQKDIISEIMDRLGDTFIYGELRASIDERLNEREVSYSRRRVIESMTWLADSHYEISFSEDTDLSERVIFPISYTETRGIEDARFVRFKRDDGSYCYCATYTAYNGFAILPKLITTEDFYHFEVKPLHGKKSTNKGMALFPRKINGKYAMLARSDGTNNYLMYSDNINIWTESQLIQGPKHLWDLVKVGNAGSPIETEYGWLVITHGIGPMRQYTLGAMLLDIDDPSKVISILKEPLLSPIENEREGYVPNVVYSCGSTINNGELVIPYAISDQRSSIATVNLKALIDQLRE